MDEQQLKQLTTLIGLFKEGEGRTPKTVVKGKSVPARLVMMGVVNETKGYAQCDPPWDVEPADEPSDLAMRALEKCQEVADGAKRSQTLLVTFYFVSNDDKMTPVAGSPGQKWSRSIPFTFEPEGGRDAEDRFHSQHDLRYEENRKAAAAQRDLDSTGRANDTLLRHCEGIANTFSEFMVRHEEAMTRMDARIERADKRADDMHDRAIKALNDEEDRMHKRKILDAQLDKDRGWTDVQHNFARALTQPVADLAALGGNAIAQYAGRAMGIAPTPVQVQIMEKLAPILNNQERLGAMVHAGKLTETEIRNLLEVRESLRMAEKFIEPTPSAKTAMTLRGPPVSVAKWKALPRVQAGYARAETQANVTGTGGK